MTEENKKYTPKDERKKGVFKLNLQPRDFEILKAINACRYMKTEQIHRLISPDKSKKVIQRRLKFLFHHGYVGRIIQPAYQGHGQNDFVYHLDTEGAKCMEENEIEVLSQGKHGNIKTMFLQHALDLADFRTTFIKAVDQIPYLEISQITLDFEIKKYENPFSGKDRYKNYRELEHPDLRRSFVVYPDALITLKGAGKWEGNSYGDKLLMVEIDRGTESVPVIKEKIIGYHLYREKKVFHNRFPVKYKGFKVLFQCSSKNRVKKLVNGIMGVEGADLALFTDVSQVNEHSFFHEPIWTDCNSQKLSLMGK